MGFSLYLLVPLREGKGNGGNIFYRVGTENIGNECQHKTSVPTRRFEATVPYIMKVEQLPIAPSTKKKKRLFRLLKMVVWGDQGAGLVYGVTNTRILNLMPKHVDLCIGSYIWGRGEKNNLKSFISIGECQTFSCKGDKGDIAK